MGSTRPPGRLAHPITTVLTEKNASIQFPIKNNKKSVIEISLIIYKTIKISPN